MKKLLLIFLLAVSCDPVFSQDKYSKSVPVDSGDTYTAAIPIKPGYAIKAIIFPTLTAGTTSFKLKAGTEPTDIDTLWYDGEVFSGTIPISGCAYSLNANLTFGWEYIIVQFGTTQTADRTLKVVFIKTEE